MTRNIHKQSFDESTNLKLKIFGECFREWLPVFIHNRYIEEIFIYDFFAGSGKDIIGTFGSPLVLLEEAKGKDRKYCSKINKNMIFSFIESLKNKADILLDNVVEYIDKCKVQNNCDHCVYDVHVYNDIFKKFFLKDETQTIFNNNNYGKFVLLDQYGFKEIDEEIFLKLIDYPKTDLIFFISSSFIKRFKEHPYTKLHIDTDQIDFDKAEPKECHRRIFEYFKKLIPTDKEYYLHHFTLQKKGNYYGLIFGTNHTFGMEKFLKVCWRQDPNSGESNCNIDNDWSSGTLFYNPSKSIKIERVETEIEDMILKKNITDNKTGFKYTIQKGCEPKLFTKVVKNLETINKIKRSGNINNKSSNIHNVKIYEIEVL